MPLHLFSYVCWAGPDEGRLIWTAGDNVPYCYPSDVRVSSALVLFCFDDPGKGQQYAEQGSSTNGGHTQFGLTMKLIWLCLICTHQSSVLCLLWVRGDEPDMKEKTVWSSRIPSIPSLPYEEGLTSWACSLWVVDGVHFYGRSSSLKSYVSAPALVGSRSRSLSTWVLRLSARAQMCR